MKKQRVDKTLPITEAEEDAWKYIQEKLEREERYCEEKADENFDGTEGCMCDITDCAC